MSDDPLDDLLRDNILVDLYPIVRSSIRVGATSYSLKSLEPLYMGNSLEKINIIRRLPHLQEDRLRTLGR